MSHTNGNPQLPSPQSRREPVSVPNGLAVAAAWTWRLLLIAFGIAVVAIVLYELKTLTLPIFVALLLTTSLVPLVHRLQRTGLSHGAATGLVLASTLGLSAVTVYLLAGTVTSQFVDLGPQVANGVDRVTMWLKDGPLGLSDAQLDRYIDQAVAQVRANTGVVSASLISGTKLAGEVVVGALLTVVLTAYFLKDGQHFSDAVVGRFPKHRQPTMRAAASKAFHTLGGYLRGVAATGVVDAALIGIALAVVGVPLIPILMLLTFFGAFFPVVGAVAAGGLAVLVALVNGGVGDAALIALAVLVVQQIEGQLLQPFLVGRSVRLHPVIIIGSLTAGAIIAGILGAFVAVPLVAMVVGAVREVERLNALEAADVPDTASGV